VPIKEIPLDQIRIDGGTQPRSEIDLRIVQEYADDMDGGATLPPGEAVFDGTVYWLWDGFHRYHAERKRGSTTMRLNVQTGTVDDAQWLSLSANKGHGLRRTKDDIIRCVESALQRTPRPSDQTIADHVGVSRSLVQLRRSELETTCQIGKSPTRTGRDGRTINTGNIGKRPASVATHVERDDTPDEDEDQDEEEIDSPDHEEYEETREYQQQRLELPVADEPASHAKGMGDYITLAQWNEMPPAYRLPGGALSDFADGSTKRFNDQGDNENIEWALWSWNPVTGCLHNCPYCYARDIANRFYEPKFEPTIWPSRLRAPFNTTFPTQKAAQWIGHKNVFTCSMADLFGRWVPREWIDAVLEVVREASQWNFLFLTKFPIRMAEFDFPDNAWVGTTVDCQARVKNAEKAFRKVKAGVKWLSIEPMIEPLTFKDLGAFQWIVLGGASASSQTSAWYPPRRWIRTIEEEAERLGVAYYEKSNLHGRIKGYPGMPVYSEPDVAPESLRYLPTDS
jgi:protein gp37